MCEIINNKEFPNLASKISSFIFYFQEYAMAYHIFIEGEKSLSTKVA
jgi:hypothetical protein